MARKLHLQVSNSQNYTADDWQTDMKLAKDARIDAFALNMAYKDKTNIPSLKQAFDAANAVDFKLLFSFDYAGNGPWPKNTIIDLISEYGSNQAYFMHESKPLVSTFEGPGNAKDWITIKEQTNCFFIPDWSSVGAKEAAQLADGVADGLFSWAAWPWGNNTIDTYVDASYSQYLEGKPYMMPISPWFYTNLPGYEKNWLWKGDSLWFDRWQQLLALENLPEFVQIISWNDYGESHYIGPLYDKAFEAFTIGEALYNFAEDMPHDGWRTILPFLIDLYKTGYGTVHQEGVLFWYRRHPVSDCATAGTTGNTATQLQLEFEPWDVLDDRIYVAALLASPAGVLVHNNGKTQYVDWEYIPDDEVGAGLWFGSVPFRTGYVRVELVKDDSVMAAAEGVDITSTCRDGFQNYNAWVGSLSLPYDLNRRTEMDLADQVCVQGKGAPDFHALCKYTCRYGYCPVSACTCTAKGSRRVTPKPTGEKGYPAKGRDANYLGLCDFACNLGYCPSEYCDTVQHPMPVPTTSPFLPDACVKGTGDGNLKGLCDYSCHYGYCPIRQCTCTETGDLVEAPPKSTPGGRAAPGVDSSYDKICDFACSRGYCPPGACELKA